MASEPVAAPADRLVIHILGSGYGESQVVLFPGPEGRCLVVDACMSKKGGLNLTAELLRELRKRTIDLLVITHADSDHLRGISELIDEFSPEIVWYSPFVNSLRAMVAVWRRANPEDRSLSELKATLGKIDDLKEEGRAELALASREPWHHQPGGCIVKPIAPTEETDAAWSSKWNRMLERAEGKDWIVSKSGKALLDGDKAIGDRPNKLSIALSIQWASRRVLLTGDVEKDHWTKILKRLDRPPATHGDLIRKVDVVKVAHHGSKGAFHEGAWERHRKDDGSTIALIAPFDDTVKLPHVETLRALAPYAGRLGITTEAGGGFERAEEAGWGAVPHPEVSLADEALPLVTIVLCPDGSTELRAAREARFFASPPQSASP